jgi:hypothetical protein
MQSKAPTVPAYLASLPADRRAAIQTVRQTILDNLDSGSDGKSGFAEAMQYGMIGYNVPHAIFPHGYHCDPRQPLPYAMLASQKNHMALYLMCCYGNPELNTWFKEQWAKSGKKLDMGKSCIRFKKSEDLALNAIGALIKRVTVKKYVDAYVNTLASTGRDPSGKKIKIAAKPSPSPRAKSPAAKSTKKKVSKKPAARAKR